MLYCKGCRTIVAVGDNQCRNCGNGFVSPLVCATCNTEVPRGSSACSRCPRGVPVSPDISVAVVVPSRQSSRAPVSVQPGAAAAALALGIPGLPLGMPAPVPETYVQQSFGVTSEVTMNGADAEILNRMQQMGALLNVLAADMNNLCGHMQSTRDVIKGCRKLALDIQEEVEVRVGPKGHR